MTFLAGFVVGIGALVNAAAHDWTDNIAHEMTIQVRPSVNRDIEAEVAKAVQIVRNARGVVSVRVFDRNESRGLLEPWLGAGLELNELPIPRLVVLELDSQVQVDNAALTRSLKEQVPSASLDDHRIWLDRLAAMANSLLSIMVMILILVLVATAMAVGFATRGAMAGNRDIVEVLHLVGATDGFIAKEFQRHFLRLGLRGGVIGVLAALATFNLFALLAGWWNVGSNIDPTEALFGAFSLGLPGYVAIALVGAGVALLTGAVSRIIVFRHLRGLD
jgi:cell division transport system permease protein